MEFDAKFQDEITSYLTVSLSGFRQMHPEMWEDALQEGYIQAWRDVAAGEDIKLKILRKAKLVSQKYFQRAGTNSFGKPHKSREGISWNSTTRDKIQVYLDEVMPVLGRYPTPLEASKALGLPRRTTQQHLLKIRAGEGDHMKYTEEHGRARTDFNHYRDSYLENFRVKGEESSEASPWENHPSLKLEQDDDFSAGSASQLDLIKTLSKLGDKPKEVLTLHLFYGYNTGDIARHLGTSSQLGAKALQRALVQLEIVTDPYQGKCGAGHTRTVENIRVSRRDTDGSFTRVCMSCRSQGGGIKAPKKTNAKIGRPPVADCPKGHGKKEYRDTRGSLRCRVCKNDAQRESARRKKNDSSS